MESEEERRVTEEEASGLANAVEGDIEEEELVVVDPVDEAGCEEEGDGGGEEEVRSWFDMVPVAVPPDGAAYSKQTSKQWLSELRRLQHQYV